MSSKRKLKTMTGDVAVARGAGGHLPDAIPWSGWPTVSSTNRSTANQPKQCGLGVILALPVLSLALRSPPRGDAGHPDRMAGAGRSPVRGTWSPGGRPAAATALTSGPRRSALPGRRVAGLPVPGTPADGRHGIRPPSGSRKINHGATV